MSNSRDCCSEVEYPDGYKGYGLSMASGGPTFEVWTDTLPAPNTPLRVWVNYPKIRSVLPINNWYYIVATFDSAQMKIYLDGDLNGTRSFFPTFARVPASFDLIVGGMGRYPDGYVFNGTIDEVKIWNRSLSAAEIKQQYYSNLQKYDLDKWNLYLNQSDLNPGSYSYFAWIKDLGDNYNSTETRDFFVNGVPKVFNVSLNTSSGENRTNENLTVHYSTFDYEGDDYIEFIKSKSTIDRIQNFFNIKGEDLK